MVEGHKHSINPYDGLSIVWIEISFLFSEHAFGFESCYGQRNKKSKVGESVKKNLSGTQKSTHKREMESSFPEIAKSKLL